MLTGIDISNHQGGSVDFDAVKASGVAYVICKASEGVDYRDKWVDRNAAELRRVGLPKGYYHYALPSKNRASDEAAWFLRALRSIGLDAGDSVHLDIEDPAFWGDASAWCLEWLISVEAGVGFVPCLYTYPSYVDERRLTDARLARYPLWWASYRTPPLPAPAPWTAWAINQYASDGRVPGVAGHCDMNRLPTDDVADFTKLGKPAQPALAWTGTLTGRAHWGGDPLRVARRGDQLVAEDGRDLTGGVVDDWTTTTQAAGQLVIDGDQV
jgi:GH25 family lysozyme M1 (1,4-beta-N-acetylmuramidase)